MTDPTKPVGPADIDAVDAVEGSESTHGADSAFAVEQNPAANAPDPLQQAIHEVAADIRAGNVPDAEAASDAVIIRLVNLRYGHLTEAQRQRVVLHLHETLHNDPRFQTRIAELIETASA